MATRSPSNEKIQEALELLQEASKDKRSEVQELLNTKYGDLKSQLLDLEKELEARGAEYARQASEVKHAGEEKTREMAGQINERVHSDPWQTMGWVAAAAGLVGYLLGRKD